MNYVSTMAALPHWEISDEHDPDEDALIRARRVVRRLEEKSRREHWTDVFECVVRIVGSGEDRPWPILRHVLPPATSAIKLPHHDYVTDTAGAELRTRYLEALPRHAL